MSSQASRLFCPIKQFFSIDLITLYLFFNEVGEKVAENPFAKIYCLSTSALQMARMSWLLSLKKISTGTQY